MVVMYTEYLHQTYLLTLESILWDNILEYPLEHPGLWYGVSLGVVIIMGGEGGGTVMTD